MIDSSENDKVTLSVSISDYNFMTLETEKCEKCSNSDLTYTLNFDLTKMIEVMEFYLTVNLQD